jgi:glycosyltransferase involved in cell wall biosynthesis
MNSVARIAYLINSLNTGGAERQLLELVRGLNRSRFLPVIYVLRPSDADASASCEVHVLTSPRLRKPFRVVHGVCALWKLSHRLRTFRPHILHAYLPEMSMLYGAMGSVLGRVPIFIGNRRSSARLYRKARWLTAAERIAMKRARFMLGNSRSLRREIQALDNFPPERLGTIYNGVDTERFRPDLSSEVRAQLGWSGEHFVIGMIANFRPCKRHLDFLDAAAALYGKLPHTRFLLAGDDRGTLAEARLRIRQLKLQGVVSILSGHSRPEKIFPAIDLCVCTSETEGFSNVLLEAMACGKPLIATAVGGNIEAIENGEQGILIPPRDPAALVSAAEMLIADPNLRRRMGQAGRARVLQSFSLTAMIHAHEQLYSSLLAGSGGSEIVPAQASLL